MPAHEVQAPRPLAPAGIDSALVHSPSMRHLAIAALALVSTACAPNVAPATDPVPPQLPVVESTAAEPTFADGFESGSYPIPSPYPDPNQRSLCVKCHYTEAYEHGFGRPCMECHRNLND